MDKEIFIREFLERIEKCAELDGENARAVKKCWVWFRRDEARAALDRLFKDLKDFVREPVKPKATFSTSVKMKTTKRKIK